MTTQQQQQQQRDFEREPRYYLIKRKNLTPEQDREVQAFIGRLLNEGMKPVEEAVVVESDWPNYEHVWKTVEQVANGTWQAAQAQLVPEERKLVPVEPKNIREGYPYTDPAFEQLCRDHGIWGTDQSALAAVFWEAALTTPNSEDT